MPAPKRRGILRSPAAAWMSRRLQPRRSSKLHARIDQLVEQIGQKVDHHRQRGKIDRDRLDHGVIAAVDRSEDFPSQPGNRKEYLDEKRADEHAGELRRHVRADWNKRLTQYVLEQNDV